MLANKKNARRSTNTKKSGWLHAWEAADPNGMAHDPDNEWQKTLMAKILESVPCRDNDNVPGERQYQ